jgi:D-alanyl-D-alanine carboxypeptidase
MSTAFDRYLPAVIERAEHEAREDGSPTIEATHLLLAVATDPEPGTARVLAAADLDDGVLRRALEREFEHSLSTVGVSATTYRLPRPSRLPSHPGMGTSAKLALERAFAAVAGKKDLRPAHLLLGILSAPVGTVPRALALAGFDREELVLRVRHELTADWP